MLDSRTIRVARRRLRLPALLALFCALSGPAPSAAQPPGMPDEEGLVNLDFENAELSDVINTIARLTQKNFIYDDRVRGRVTIVSPTRVTVDQAYAVFESVLQVKGFTTVLTPGGSIKIIPVREAKESSVDTVQSERPPPNRDLFVTRLIPLNYIDAEAIVNTLKPLVSKDAAMAAYAPTNTVILTESASNIRRILSILESIDIESYQNDVAVIRVEYADAPTLADQISEIYGAEVAGATTAAARRTTRRSSRTPTPTASTGEAGRRVRIITDERTNSLIVLASRTALEEVRDLVYKLDVPVTGGGRIHVYYLKNADAEELSSTLQSLISGQASSPAGAPAAGGQAQTLRAAVSALAEGISVTADPATNALVIQASQEGFAAVSAVIEKLDIERPQVLVEALILEVNVSDNEDLGFSGVLKLVNGDTKYQVESLASAAARGAVTGGTGVDPEMMGNAAEGVLGLFGSGTDFAAVFEKSIIRSDDSEAVIRTVLTASADISGINIISAPHILTSDNEEAEIQIGDNIPIISSRVQQATGNVAGLGTSVNVERQDIGVTLRVTPQITEGDTLRLDIFEELTAVNPNLSEVTGSATEVGVSLFKRRIENTVVVADGETVVIGGLISDNYSDAVRKVPWLGDIPVLGWFFKSTSRTLEKRNLLLFLTPHIIRAPEDLERETIRKREEYFEKGGKMMHLTARERRQVERERQQAQLTGRPYRPPASDNPVRATLLEHETRYPLERMREIEERQAEERARAARSPEKQGEDYFVQAAVFGDEQAAQRLLTELVDAGWDGALLSTDSGGGVVLYEVRLGPFTTPEDARRVADVVARSHGLAPAVIFGGGP